MQFIIKRKLITIYYGVYVMCKTKVYNNSTKTKEKETSTLLQSSYTLLEVLYHLNVDWDKLMMHSMNLYS